MDLLPRLIQNLDGTNERISNAFHDHSLESFQDFTDSEIEEIRSLLETITLQKNQTLLQHDENINEYDSTEEEEYHETSTQSVVSKCKSALSPSEFDLDSINMLTKEKVIQLFQTEEWMKLTLYMEQVKFLVENLHFQECQISFSEIGKLFKRNRGTIMKAYERSLIDKKPHGRPPILDSNILESVIEFVHSRYDELKPASYEDIIDFLDYSHQINILPDTVRHMIRKCSCLKSIIGIPMEKERIMADPEKIQNFYSELEELIDDTPASLVFNLDESGFQEWTDRCKITVVVPISHLEERIEIPKDRSSKRSSLLVCIAADGTFLKPLIIITRKTAELEIFNVGYTPNRTILCYQENGFITTTLFEKWADEVFFPEVYQRRELLSFFGWAILILDGCSSHTSDSFHDQCFEQGIIPLFIPPHSSDQIQPLDLGIFGIQKTGMGRVHPPQWLSTQSQQLYKILGSWFASATPPNIISAFNQMGIHVEWNSDSEILIAKANRALARNIRIRSNNVMNKKRISVE